MRHHGNFPWAGHCHQVGEFLTPGTQDPTAAVIPQCVCCITWNDIEVDADYPPTTTYIWNKVISIFTPFKEAG